MARVRATSAMLSRCYLGDLPANTALQAPLYDPRSIPLEAMVERRRMRAADENDPRMLGFAIENVSRAKYRYMYGDRDEERWTIVAVRESS